MVVVAGIWGEETVDAILAGRVDAIAAGDKGLRLD